MGGGGCSAFNVEISLRSFWCPNLIRIHPILSMLPYGTLGSERINHNYIHTLLTFSERLFKDNELILKMMPCTM